MVHRADPAADTQAVGRGDGAAEPALGLGHGLGQGRAAREERGDRRGQRAAGAMGIAGGMRGPSSQISVRSASSRSGLVVAARWPPLSSTLAGPSARRRRPLLHCGAIGRAPGAPSRAPASGRLGVIRSRQRQEPLAQGADRLAAQQAVAALGDHHRIEHDARRTPALQAVGHGRDGLRRAEHADLDRVDLEVGEDGSRSAAHEAGATAWIAWHAQRVLRGQRGDRPNSRRRPGPRRS